MSPGALETFCIATVWPGMMWMASLKLTQRCPGNWRKLWVTWCRKVVQEFVGPRKCSYNGGWRMSGLMVIGQNYQFWKLKKQIEYLVRRLWNYVKLTKVEGPPGHGSICCIKMEPLDLSLFFGADRFETADQITFMNSYLFLAVSQYQLLALTWWGASWPRNSRALVGNWFSRFFFFTYLPVALIIARTVGVWHLAISASFHSQDSFVF